MLARRLPLPRHRLIPVRKFQNLEISALRATPRRLYSTPTPEPTPSPSGSDSKWRVSTVFTVLLGLGIGTTAYGLYDIYTTLTMWPPEVRGDLRAAITAKRQENYELSERYFRKALEAVKILPLELFSPEPYLKLSGISTALAEVCLAQGAPQRAYEVYADALSQLQNVSQEDLSVRERLRSVAIAMKLGELAETYSQPEDEEEKWLTFAVEEVLRLLRDPSIKTSEDSKEREDQASIVIAELELPRWVEKSDIGAPLEALGAFYARVGKPEYAMPLYLQAISLLIPPPSQRKRTPPEDRCRGALMMGNLCELITRDQPTPDRLHQAEAWAKQAIDVLQKASAETSGGNSLCEEGLVSAFFNLASLKEMSGESKPAGELFSASLTQAHKIGMKEGITEAQLALQRLDRIERAKNRVDPLLEVEQK